MLDIVSIGSGGGSIAWIEGKMLKVGPQSAAAVPGPACYGRGGLEPTVTDADLILGYLNPDYFCGGLMKLIKELAYSAIEEKIAKPLGMNVEEAAAGIHDVVNSTMADLIRKATVEHGYDPREFAVVGFGGAGPTHGSAYIKELKIPTLIVSPLATAFSAFGVLLSDLKHTFALSDLMVVSPDMDLGRINENYSRLEKQATETFKKEKEIVLARSVDMRFRRQVHEVIVPVPRGELTKNDLERVVKSFEEKYEMLYGKGSSYREAGVEMLTYRLDAYGLREKPTLPKHEIAGPDPSKALKAKREVFFRELNHYTTTSIYDGDRLRAGNVVEGPAVIEYKGTTVVIRPGQRGRLDEYLNLIVES